MIQFFEFGGLFMIIQTFRNHPCNSWLMCIFNYSLSNGLPTIMKIILRYLLSFRKYRYLLPTTISTISKVILATTYRCGPQGSPAGMCGEAATKYLLED